MTNEDLGSVVAEEGFEWASEDELDISKDRDNLISDTHSMYELTYYLLIFLLAIYIQ